MRLFLGGDVMLGRALDALMPHPSDPRPLEGSTSSPKAHLSLIESARGKMMRPLAPESVWNDLLPDLRSTQIDLRLINLECAITTSDDLQPRPFATRLHPGNLRFLQAIAPDFCCLANNHTMDWGAAGLRETREILERAGIATAGAGENIEDAQAPAVLWGPDGRRVLVFALTSFFAGSPMSCRAGSDKAGQWVLPAFTEDALVEVLEVIARYRRTGDLIILSVHWGGNWSRDIDPGLRQFSHGLIDGGVDLIHGHSSHHVRPIEVYRRRLILYGCGDLVNDYCYELVVSKRIAHRRVRYRPELELAYFADLDIDGALEGLTMVPYRLEGLSLHRASNDESEWLATALTPAALTRRKAVVTQAGDTLILQM